MEEQAKPESHRMNFSQYIDKLFWVLLAFLANNIGQEARSINESIKILNEKMASVISNINNQSQRLDSLDARLLILEKLKMEKK